MNHWGDRDYFIEAEVEVEVEVEVKVKVENENENENEVKVEAEGEAEGAPQITQIFQLSIINYQWPMINDQWSNDQIQVSHFPTPRIIWDVKLNNLR
jgi:hypothetical protein